MIKEQFKYKNRDDKAVMFFSSPSIGDTRLLLERGIYDILYSYHYARKALTFCHEELMPEIAKNGGYFMADSGAFSFFNDKKVVENEEAYTEEYWLPYLEEYVEWVDSNASRIFCCANLDLDNIVGRDVVNKWNSKYFEPLSKKVQVIYVAHENKEEYNDPAGLNRLKEYLVAYQYVGVNQALREHAASIYKQMVMHGRRIHGFAWTSYKLLKSYPFFSVDSSTWLGGSKYGTTYDYDGKNFRTLNYEKKHLRKTSKYLCKKTGIDYDALREEERKAVNSLNLEGWKGARREYLRAANVKLRTDKVKYYVKRAK